MFDQLNILLHFQNRAYKLLTWSTDLRVSYRPTAGVAKMITD